MSATQDDSTFPARVREERERLGLTQTEFGRLGGVSKMAQWKNEQWKHWPTLEYIQNLQASGGIDIVYLVTGNRDSKDRIDWRLLRDAFLLVQRSLASRADRNFTDEQLFDAFQSVVETAMGLTRPDLLGKVDEKTSVAGDESAHVKPK